MRIVVVGKNSYIGEHVKTYLQKFGHTVVELDTIGEEFKTFDYTKTDVVIHVAAIVHEDAKNASKSVFYKVNTQLPFLVANYAKKAGVSLFIFMSSMAVYGCEKSLPNGTVITADTPLNPISLYGRSKLEAENALRGLNDNAFRVAIVRPPNVYGKDCKGNYMSSFKKLVTTLPVFPKVFLESRQSMLYIDNLSELIRLIINNNADGIYTPQDDYVPNTCDLIDNISKALRHKKKISAFLGVFIKPFSFISIIKKLYGGISYSLDISCCFNGEYQLVSFKDGLMQTFSN